MGRRTRRGRFKKRPSDDTQARRVCAAAGGEEGSATRRGVRERALQYAFCVVCGEEKTTTTLFVSTRNAAGSAFCARRPAHSPPARVQVCTALP